MLMLEQQREIQSRNAVLERTTLEQEHRIEKLKREIAALKRKLFGGTQGETVSDEQLQLALAELEAERREQEVSEKEVAGYKRRGKKIATLSPDHLEVIREVIIPEEVQADPEAREWISDEVTEEFDIEPTRFIKRLIIRPKYVRKGVVDAKPVVAKFPPRV